MGAPPADHAPTVRVASAGTGKTTSLVRRYLELVDQGVALRRVAGVTFTRAAADELRQRVAQAIEDVLRRGAYLDGLFTPSAGSEPRFELARNELEGALLTTIHGFMIAGLRLNAPQLGLDPNFGTMAEWEAQALFETELRSLLLLARDKDHRLAQAAQFLGHEALPKARKLFQKRSLAQELTFGPDGEARALEQLYSAALASYDRRLGSSSLAPGEVERRALRMLSVAGARARVARRFQRVLVDEYQDVNPLQGRYFELLAEAGVALELVGDPKQSIYGFRNADVTVFRRALVSAERSGGVLPPLDESRRHSRAVLGLLNRLTDHLAASGKGWEAQEAPAVAGAGAQAQTAGLVELQIVRGERALGDLRLKEAEVLAQRLAAHHAAGTSYGDMAVLARSYAGLAMMQRALTKVGVPSVIGQGRGYYERPEIRDVHHALSVGLDPGGASLPPFLRGPFAALELTEVADILAQPAGQRVTYLAQHFPAVGERLEWLAQTARQRPLAAIKSLLREPVLDGQRFPELLGERARENVDALLFDIAANPPADIALLLERLELLARQADAGDVPQSGAGVTLLTVHASKGLEFPLTAIFDTGAWPSQRVDGVLVEPATGQVRLQGEEEYPPAAAAQRQRQQQESYRLLYVAASRARDTLLLSGSSGSRGAYGWLAELQRLRLTGEGGVPGVSVQVHDYQPPLPAPDDGAGAPPPLEAAPYLDARWPRSELPPVFSPSLLSLMRAQGAEGEEEYEEPLPAAVLASAEREIERGRVGWGRARGTLTHYAIGQDWLPDDQGALQTLRAQEVLFPFSEAQRTELVDEVVGLLRAYRALLGRQLPSLEARSVDRAELPLAVRRGEHVWEGVVDRLYRVDGDWLLDDYKTDVRVEPERYYVQLGLYLEALEQALGARPRGRLVFLRSGQVIEPSAAQLEEAVREALGDEA